MRTWKLIACLIPITLGASIAIGVQANSIGTRDGIRTVDFPRTGPCATCGHATPVKITCDGTDWIVYSPGTVEQAASSVCASGTTYSWELQS